MPPSPASPAVSGSLPAVSGAASCVPAASAVAASGPVSDIAPSAADATGAAPRRIRSFTRRQGHFSDAQRQAVDALMPRYGLDTGLGPARFAAQMDASFGRTAPRVLEIGFGMGHATLAVAHANPDVDFVAIDVHLPGVGAVLRRIESAQLRNLRLLVGDAVDLLATDVAAGSLDAIHLWFPDPWPKARHVKRRLVDETFLRLACDRLRPGGYLHLATDWSPYAVQMAHCLAGVPDLRPDDASSAFRLHAAPADDAALEPLRSVPATAPGGARAHLDAQRRADDAQAAALADPRPPWRPRTRFEWRGHGLGHPSFDFVRRRRADAAV